MSHRHVVAKVNQRGLWLMDVILHLGAQRSGSSTFQSFLRANRMKLAKRGLTSWLPKRTRGGMFNGLLRHPAMITQADTDRAGLSITNLRREVDRLERAGQNALLISEENLLGTMRNNVRDRRLYPLVTDRLRRIAPAFEGRKLKIGLCVRSYDAFWTSSLTYLLAHGADQPSQVLLDDLSTQSRQWADVVRDIAEAIPQADIIVWPFERSANVPASVLGHVWNGGCDDLGPGQKWVNKSWDIVQLNQMMTLRGDAPLQQGLMSSSKRWLPFSEEQRQAMRAQYRHDIAWLSAGADGLARFVDGWPTSATRPDRADVTHAIQTRAAPMRGRQDGIEERMGRTGAG